ncbi:MAG TPA: BatD family protein [Lacibacter sp.]|nr:BatD family protein [Lacibacter sp.]
MLSLNALAQSRLMAIPSKTVVHPDETFQLQYVVEGTMQADDFVAPSFRNFEQIGDVVQTNGWTWVNGSLTEYLSYTYLLRPKLKGKLSIASAVAKTKGRILTSPIIIIQVTDAVPVNKDVTADANEEKPDYYLLPNEDAKDKIKKNLFVKATVDKQSCYTGEALLATFKLYTRLDSESKILKRPSFNGFSVIDLEEPEAGIFTKEMINGKLYNCYLIRKVQLFPLQSGEVTIEPVQIINKVRLIRSSSKDGKEWMDALNKKEKIDETVIEEELITETPSLKITVLDLPQSNKPESFNGAVGVFTIEAQLEKHEFPADESGVLKLAVKGSGNITMVNTPAVNWPQGVETLEPKANEEVDKLTTPVHGIKMFEIPFTAVKGSYKIPPVVFSFFDVMTKTYQTIKTDSLFFTVKEALQKKGKALQLPQENIETKATTYTNYIYIAGAVFALLLGWGGLLYFRKKKKPVASVETTAESIPIEPAETFIAAALQVKDSLHEKQFYPLLMDGLQQFMIDRFQLQQTRVTSAALIDILKQKQLHYEASLWASIVNRCEEAMFSPLQLNISKDELLRNAEVLMRSVDEILTLP